MNWGGSEVGAVIQLRHDGGLPQGADWDGKTKLISAKTKNGFEKMCGRNNR